MNRDFPFLDSAINIFQHHNGVIHDQTHRQNQTQQGEQIDAESQPLHHRKGTDDGDWNGHQWNHRGTPIPQEYEDRQHHECTGDIKAAVDFHDRSLDKVAGVVGNIQIDPFGQIFPDLRQQRFDFIGHSEQVGLRLFFHLDPDRGPAVIKCLDAIIIGSEFHPAHIGKFHLGVAPGRQHQIFKVHRVVHAALQSHTKLTGHRLDPTAGHINVLLPKGALYIRNCQAVGRQPVGVDPEPHGKLWTTQSHPRYPRHDLQTLGNRSAGDLSHFKSCETIRIYRNGQHRIRIGIRLTYFR